MIDSCRAANAISRRSFIHHTVCAGVEEPKRLLPVTIDKCLPYISPVSRDRIGKRNPPYDETYVISENLFHVAETSVSRIVWSGAR